MTSGCHRLRVLYRQFLLHSQVTDPDSTFHRPQHPQLHPSLENPGVHPLILTLLENPGLTVLFRAQRLLGTQETARFMYPPTFSKKLLSPFMAPSFTPPPPPPTSPNLALGLGVGAEAPETSV